MRGDEPRGSALAPRFVSGGAVRDVAYSAGAARVGRPDALAAWGFSRALSCLWRRSHFHAAVVAVFVLQRPVRTAVTTGHRGRCWFVLRLARPHPTNSLHDVPRSWKVGRLDDFERASVVVGAETDCSCRAAHCDGSHLYFGLARN